MPWSVVAELVWGLIREKDACVLWTTVNDKYEAYYVVFLAKLVFLMP